MPFLKQQINIINASLLAVALKDARFEPGRFEAIAVDVTRKTEKGTETFPAVMDINYEAQEISIDDTYPIIVYHKVGGKQYAIEKGQYGDNNAAIIETCQVKMVVYGKFSALKLTREQLEAVITTNFPDNISPKLLSVLKLDNMTVTLRSSNLNSAQVFQEEYKGFELALAPEDILFSINYTIDTRYHKGCFKLCDCN